MRRIQELSTGSPCIDRDDFEHDVRIAKARRFMVMDWEPIGESVGRVVQRLRQQARRSGIKVDF